MHKVCRIILVVNVFFVQKGQFLLLIPPSLSFGPYRRVLSVEFTYGDTSRWKLRYYFAALVCASDCHGCQTRTDNPLEPSHITSEGKWAGSLNEFPLDCTLYAAWDLFSDWSHWDRFRSGKIVAELREGENRKPGAVRFHDYPDDGFWITERLLTIDEDEHTLSFDIENHTFLGGAMTGYNGWVKVKSETATFLVIH